MHGSYGWVICDISTWAPLDSNIRPHSSVQRNNRMATVTRDEPKGKHVFLRL